MKDKLRKLYRLLIAILIILFKGFVLFLAMLAVNYVTNYLFDFVIFSQNFDLASYLYSVTIVTLIDAIDYNYEKVELI